jgi:AraC-like DNA-binding protein
MKEILETIFLLAAVQGILLAVVLLIRKQNHAANKILALATFFLSIDLLTAVYYSKGWYLDYPHLMGIAYPFPLSYGPFFYLYVKVVSKKADKFHGIDLLHFLPVVIVYLLCIPIFLYNGEQKIEFVNNMIHGIHSPMFTVFETILPIQGLVYTFFTFKIVREYDRKIKDEFSNIDLINLNWLKYITFLGLAIWFIVALVSFDRILTPSFHALVPIFMSIFIYSVGYKGLRQPEIFLNPSAVPSEPPQSEKYKRSGLSDKLAEEIKQELVSIMTSEKLYLDNDLTLQKLADRMNISSHNLSEVINSKLNLSYYDFINCYRVEEFKRRVVDPENEKYNLLSIAFDSGFKSKGTFNSIFKKLSGMTPSEYKSKIPQTTQRHAAG